MLIHASYSIPYLKFNNLAVYFETKGPELHSNGHLMLSFELIVHNSLHEATLAHTCVSNDNQLEQMILGIK